MKSPLRKILLVDDDPDIRSVVQYALEAVGGYEVRACGDGGSALEQVDSFAPDMVLLDVMMSDIEGPALVPLLRRTRGGACLPVVFLTARSDAEEAVHYRHIGAIDVIAKPFDPLTLPERVAGIWRDAGEDGSAQ